MQTHDSSFVFLGNHAATDFVNTQVVQRGERIDLLACDADLIHWAGKAGYNLEGPLQTEDLSTAKTLRAALSELFLANIEARDAPQSALDGVNKHLKQHAQHQLLQRNPANGKLELVPDKYASSIPAFLAKLASEGAQLLASPQASYIKRCSNPECVLFFLDTSRTRKRRWCSMEICGNRAKVAKHYQKQMQ